MTSTQLSRGPDEWFYPIHHEAAPTFLPHRCPFPVGTLRSAPESSLTDPGETKRPQATPNSPPLLSAHRPGISETISWLDWWLSTPRHRPTSRGSSHRDRKPSPSSAARQSQPWLTYSSPAGTPLLTEVRSTVPAEELSLLRHSPLPPAAAIFPRYTPGYGTQQGSCSLQRCPHPQGPAPSPYPEATSTGQQQGQLR